MLKELAGFGVLSLWIIVPFLIFVAGAIALWFAVANARTTRRKWIAGTCVALVVILFPTWDEIAGRAYFSHLCTSDAGIRVHKRVGLDSQYLGTQLPDTAWAYKKSPMAAAYPYALESVEDILGPARIYYVKESIRDQRTGETLGTVTNYFYRGGWLQNAVSPQGAGGGSCALEQDYFKRLLEAIFVGPKKDGQ